MEIIFVHNKNTNEITEGMKGIAYKRLHSLEKFLKEDEPIKFTVKTYKKGLVKIKCEVILKDNRIVHIENKGEDYYQVITALKEDLKERIIAKREKRDRRAKTVRVINHYKDNLYDQMRKENNEILLEEAV